MKNILCIYSYNKLQISKKNQQNQQRAIIMKDKYGH